MRHSNEDSWSITARETSVTRYIYDKRSYLSGGHKIRTFSKVFERKYSVSVKNSKFEPFERLTRSEMKTK